MRFPPRACRFLPCAVLLALLTCRAELSAQQRPAAITAAQSSELPYRLTGRLNVTFGTGRYLGTATFIRRYTGLTAGHLLYDPDGGLATDVYYEPALYQEAETSITVGFFAVLAGYQNAAGIDPDSDAAFVHDTGYVLFNRPAPGAEWADFAADTGALVADKHFLVFGYAYQKGTFAGNVQTFVNVAAPFYLGLGPALYSNTSYYTESGMSGGPLYVTDSAGVMRVAAVTVAGTSLKDPALSDVRAITATDQTLFTETEYAHHLITSGTIKGPAAMAAGGTGKYKTGVVFKDGVHEGRDLPPRYDELYLQVDGEHKSGVTITKLKTGKYKVKFSSKLASGDVVTLNLLRNTRTADARIPLQALTVTVQ